jgi:hypothetical protein
MVLERKTFSTESYSLLPTDSYISPFHTMHQRLTRSHCSAPGRVTEPCKISKMSHSLGSTTLSQRQHAQNNMVDQVHATWSRTSEQNDFAVAEILRYRGIHSRV